MAPLGEEVGSVNAAVKAAGRFFSHFELCLSAFLIVYIHVQLRVGRSRVLGRVLRYAGSGPAPDDDGRDHGGSQKAGDSR